MRSCVDCRVAESDLGLSRLHFPNIWGIYDTDPRQDGASSVFESGYPP